MPAADSRKPALVREAFSARVAGLLAPLGFEVMAKGNLIRRHGKTKHRVEFSSSHRNVAAHVVCWVTFRFQDKVVETRRPGWAAGGNLSGHSFDPEWTKSNISISSEADALADLLMTRLSYFDLLEHPEAMLREVSRRYVRGFFAPSLVVPYLSAHLGPEAVATYAQALLNGRPELWPAYASENEQPTDSSPSVLLDHGTQLARAIVAEGMAVSVAAPANIASSADPQAAALRSFFGLQLRAWGEIEAAAELRKLPDPVLRDLHVAQDALQGPLVDSPDAARILLRAAVGQDRTPRRLAPEPRLFQYYQLHQPFA